jgi:hypothetical protein
LFWGGSCEISPMKQRRRILWVALACALVVLVAALLWPREREPVYHGKSLTQWLQRIQTHNVETEDYEALEAVRQIGTNALPCLVRWISYHGPPRWKQKLSPAADKMPRLIRDHGLNAFIYETKAHARVPLAVTGFRILGPAASPAIPALVASIRVRERLNGPPVPIVGMAAATALASIGKAALPDLLDLLTDTYGTRSISAYCAIRYSENGMFGAAVNGLIIRLHGSNEGVAKTAPSLLVWLDLDLSRTVRALWTALRDPRPAVQLAAAEALKRLANKNSAALAALEQARAADDPLHVRSDALLRPPGLSGPVRQSTRELIAQPARELIEAAILEGAAQTNRQAN